MPAWLFPPGSRSSPSGVADLARATEFYRSLGWEPTPYSSEEITFIQTSGSMLALFPT